MQTLKWHKIADSIKEIAWQSNKLALVEAGGKKVTLALVKDQVYACAHKCPHASGLMADGFVDALANIVCPLHRYKFNLTNGRNTSGEGYYLKVFPIELRDAGIFIGFAETGWLDFLK